MKPACLFLFLCHSLHSLSQGISSPLLTRYTGVGTYSSRFTDVFSFASNQAALSQVRSFTAGVYAERRFMLKELDQFAAFTAIPLHQGGAGISAFHSGRSQYSASQIALAYGRALGPGVSLGVQFNYHLVSIAGYGNSRAVNAEIGTIIRITGNLFTGLHLYNVLNRHRNEVSRKLPAVYTFALGYELSEIVYLSAEMAKVEDQAVNVNVALHYALAKQLFIRAGVATGSNHVFFGTGVKWKNARMDVIASYHPQLGVTPSLLLVFGRQNEKEKE